MSETDNHIAEISSTVWHFVDEIAGGKVADELLYMHGISDVAANAIKTPGYVGRNVYRRKIFMHLMKSIGYYDLLSQGYDNVISLYVYLLYFPSNFQFWEHLKCQSPFSFFLI